MPEINKLGHRLLEIAFCSQSASLTLQHFALLPAVWVQIVWMDSKQ